MASYDLVIRGGTIATASDTYVGDIGVKDGVIVDLGRALGPGTEEIDAKGKYVLPGGIDSHVHIEQRSSFGNMNADDFFSGTSAAAFGGNTTVIPFATQHKTQESLRQVVNDYHAVAGPKAVIDYAFHLIISNPTPSILGQELPALIQDGYTSFKVYMTYDLLKLNDTQMLDILSVARATGALTMVHAENYDMIKWVTAKLLAQGMTLPKYHGTSHVRIAECEATNRAISLAELVDVPMLLVHVSIPEAIDGIRLAQTRGLKIYGETCPQYLFLTAKDMDRAGLEGAMFCCSPPLRDEASQEAVWQGLANGTFQVISSDHAPFRFDSGESGKLPKGDQTKFTEMANGLPGIETRLPLVFSGGVMEGRIDINRFVAIGATNHAKLYGIYPRKGTIAIGSDADIAIWDKDVRKTLSAKMLHDGTGYTPFEGIEVQGWPTTVILRGRPVIVNNELKAARGSGQFLRAAPPEMAKPLGRKVQEFAALPSFKTTPSF